MFGTNGNNGTNGSNGKNAHDLITDLGGIGVKPGQQAGQEARKPSEYWVNVGLERGGKLVSLPMGIPLDKLQARRVPSPKTQNQEFRNLRLAEAQLWEKIREIMASLKPGEEVTLPFVVKLRMIDEKEVIEDVDQSENPFAVGDFTVTK